MLHHLLTSVKVLLSTDLKNTNNKPLIKGRAGSAC